MLFVINYLSGAFAKAVIIVIEAVGTRPNNANKGAQALRRGRTTRTRERRLCAAGDQREQVGPDTGLLTKTAG